MTTDHENSLEILRQAHRFPGPFVFKVIGDNTSALIAQVSDAVVATTGAGATPTVTTRQSAGGRHLAITLTTQVDSAEQVQDVYAALKALPGVRFLL